jgi:hypothetical protein
LGGPEKRRIYQAQSTGAGSRGSFYAGGERMDARKPAPGSRRTGPAECASIGYVASPPDKHRPPREALIKPATLATTPIQREGDAASRGFGNCISAA